MSSKSKIIFLIAAGFVTGSLVFLFAFPDKGDKAVAGVAPRVAATNQNGPLWNKRCGKDEKGAEACEVFQSLVVTETGQRLVEVALSLPKGQDKAKAAIIVPLGIIVGAGVALQVDSGESLNVPIRGCDQGGCLALAEFSPKFIDAMRYGSTLNIVFLGGTQQKLHVPVNLKGFDTVWAQVR